MTFKITTFSDIFLGRFSVSEKPIFLGGGGGLDAIILIFSSQRRDALAPLELFKAPSLVRKLGGLAFCRRLGGSSGEQLWMEALTHCQKRRLWPQNGGTRGRGGAEETRQGGTETFVNKSESPLTFPFLY